MRKKNFDPQGGSSSLSKSSSQSKNMLLGPATRASMNHMCPLVGCRAAQEGCLCTKSTSAPATGLREREAMTPGTL